MPQTPIEIWTISLDTPRPIVLSGEEQERAARFHFERDRVRWSRARSALRTVLANYVDAAPESLHFRYGEHGKPTLDGSIEFSLSHSGGWAMIAIARETPVGIDLEEVREKVDIAKLLRRIGEEGSGGTTAELFHEWTRREASTKVLGIPLMQKPAGNLHVADVRAPDGFAASVAVLGGFPIIDYRTEFLNY